MGGSLPEAAYSVLFCVTGALIAGLLLRLPLRRVFGSRIAYQIWLLVPTAAVAATLGSLAPARALAPMALPIQIPDVRWMGSPSPAALGPIEGVNWVVVGWMIGAGLLALLQWWQQHAFVRRLGALQRTPNGAWISEANDIGPVVVGALQPKIVLPADFHQRYTSKEQALVLAHESMHISRRDPLINLTAAIVRSLLWFHPLLHLAIRYFRIDQEFACDAAVLNVHSHDRQHYAYAMLKGQLGGPALPAGCRLDSHAATCLQRRILMLQLSSPNRRRRVLGTLAIGASLVAACTLGTGVQASNPGIQVVGDLDAPVEGKIPTPRYPAALQGSGTDGWVDLQYVVDTTGHVEPSSFKILNQTNKAFVEPAEEAVLSGVYTPAKFRGQPVRQLVQARVAFREGADSTTP
jgi:beta-lactamase regulating signal transducer with metallopeptidase domain